MIQKESYGFNTFAATRIGEIQKTTNPTEWFWISGEHNIADILTETLGIDSTWQNSPDFMSYPLMLGQLETVAQRLIYLKGHPLF